MRTALILVILIILSGCTLPYQMDMKEQRRLNLTQDLTFLRPEETLELPDPLTLDDAVMIGLENNLEMRISRIMTEIADENALSEKLKILPQLNLNAELSQRSDYDLKEYENLDTGEKTLGRSISEEKTRKAINLSLSWNVLDFGLSFIRARQAAMKNEIQRMEQLRQSQKLAMDISAAYTKAVLAEQELDYIIKIEAEAEKYKKKAETMVEENRIDPISAKAIEKRIADLAITAANIQADISGARLELCRLMGLSPLRDFSFTQESLETYLEKIPKSDTIDPEALEMLSLNHRPECFAADIQSLIQKDEARAALVSMFPGVRFDISNHYDDNKYLVNNYWSTIGMSVMTNFLSLPSKYVNWKAQKKTGAMVKLQRLMISAGIIVQVHIALHDFRVKEKEFRLHNNAYSISKDLLNMSKERYELGALSETVITQQMMEHLISRLSRNRSLVDLINAYNMLLVTVGLDYSDWNKDL